MSYTLTRLTAAAAVLVAAAVPPAERPRLFRRDATRSSWAEMGEARGRREDLTVCTLVDGRGRTLSSDVEVEIPHLLDTAMPEFVSRARAGGGRVLATDVSEPIGTTSAFVLVDCEGEQGQQVLHRVEALRDKLKDRTPFKYSCVDTSPRARAEWSSMWLEDPKLADPWPKDYITTLRLALHQCMYSMCRTQYCAWSDSDLVMVPHFAAGWARGALNCLLGAQQNAGPQDQPVFAVLPPMQDTTPIVPSSEESQWGYQFDEFSSQAFVVDRNQLYDRWLPIERAVMNYTDVNRYLKMGIILREHLLESAIERLIVAKSTSEYDHCESEGRHCPRVVSCNPEPAWKMYYEDYADSVNEVHGKSSFISGFTEAYRRLSGHHRMDVYTREVQGCEKEGHTRHEGREV